MPCKLHKTSNTPPQLVQSPSVKVKHLALMVSKGLVKVLAIMLSVEQ